LLPWQWFIGKCSKLTERFRYTPKSVFDTFPWPQFDMGGAPAPGAADRALAVGTGAPKGCREGAATDTRGACAPLSKQSIAKIEAVAEAARELRRVRAEALAKLKGGLRALYRTLELPGARSSPAPTPRIAPARTV
jgi:hypothetical protein